RAGREGLERLSRDRGGEGWPPARRRAPLDQRLPYGASRRPGLDRRQRVARQGPADERPQGGRRQGPHRHGPAPCRARGHVAASLPAPREQRSTPGIWLKHLAFLMLGTDRKDGPFGSEVLIKPGRIADV